MRSQMCQRYYESWGVGSVQNVLQEGMGARQTITGSSVMLQLWVQLLAGAVTHLGPVPLILMLTPDLQHGQCSGWW
jgi:hypothetical protein